MNDMTEYAGSDFFPVATERDCTCAAYWDTHATDCPARGYS